MNSLRSASVNMRCRRTLPRPRVTYFSSPAFMCPLSVLMEQPSLAAACAAVLSPSGGDWCGRCCLRGTAPQRAASSKTIKDPLWGRVIVSLVTPVPTDSAPLWANCGSASPVGPATNSALASALAVGPVGPVIWGGSVMCAAPIGVTLIMP
jgi:hypothetical protein